MINEAVSLEDFFRKENTGQKFICLGSATNFLKKELQPGSSYLVIVGPEGDFTETEISSAVKNNFIPVSLGPSRLRAETAGVVASSIVSLLND